MSQLDATGSRCARSRCGGLEDDNGEDVAIRRRVNFSFGTFRASSSGIRGETARSPPSGVGRRARDSRRDASGHGEFASLTELAEKLLEEGPRDESTFLTPTLIARLRVRRAR